MEKKSTNKQTKQKNTVTPSQENQTTPKTTVQPIVKTDNKAERDAIAKQIQELESSIASMTPANTRTAESYAEAGRKAAATKTPEQRSEYAKKAWVTIRAKKAARAAAIAAAIELRNQLTAKLGELAA